MRDPEPKSIAETTRQEGARSRVKSPDDEPTDGGIDASDPAVAEAAKVADQVNANA